MYRTLSITVLLFAALSPAQDLRTAERLYRSADYVGALGMLAGADEDAAFALAGKAHYGNGDFPAAIEALKKATAAAPDDAHYWNWLGKAYGQQAAHGGMFGAMGNARKCRSAFEKAVELAPDDMDALGDLFSYYLNAPGILGGGVEKARVISERVGRLDAAEYEFTLAAIARKRKNWAAAERHFREAIELDPKRIGRRLDLAAFLSARGEYEESDHLFAAATERHPATPKIWFREAAAHIKAKRRLAEARELLERYLKAGLTSQDPPRWEAEKLLEKVASD